MTMNIFLLFIIPLWIIGLVVLALFIFYRYIYRNYKINTTNTEFDTLMSVLNIVVRTEIDLYEKNIFDTKGALTPQNFENYYNDIVHNIIDSLSPEFYSKIQEFIRNEAVVAYICRNVKDYLQSKVNGSI